MNNLVNVAFEGKPVFTATDGEGTVWFSAKNVAEALGYKQPKLAVQNWVDEKDRIALCDLKNPIPQRGVDLNPPLEMGCNPGIAAANFARQTMISKRTVLRFLMRCNAPKAEPFQDWLLDEVLPAIEKTGSYAVAAPPPPTPMYFQMGLDETRVTALRLALESLTLARSASKALALGDYSTLTQVRMANQHLNVMRGRNGAWLGAAVSRAAKAAGMSETFHGNPTAGSQYQSRTYPTAWLIKVVEDELWDKMELDVTLRTHTQMDITPSLAKVVEIQSDMLALEAGVADVH